MPNASVDKPTGTAPLNGVFAKVYSDIVNDRMKLPSLPDLALRIRAAMRDPMFDVNSVARVVQTDPGVSSYVIRVGNSPLLRRRVPIENVRGAVARLGAPVIRDLVTAYTLRSMFTTPARSLTVVMRECWQASATLAGLASVLATRCAGFSPDRAMLAGLLQDIGSLPLLRALAERPLPPEDLQRVRATLDAFAPKVGVVLLQHWGFDEDIVEVARSRGDWFRDPDPAPDLADLILVARLHACVGKPQMHEMPRINEVPAFAKLPFGELGPQASLAILDEAHQEVDEVLKMLGV